MVRRWLPIGIAALGVVACGGDDGGGGGGGGEPPPPQIIDIVADTNRDGILSPLDPTEQTRENEWDAEVGAAFIANLDDDDSDRIRDCEDEIVNGDADKWDLASFAVTAWPTVPELSSGVVTIDAEAAENVRIFKQGLDGKTTLVLGSIGPCTGSGDCTYTLEHRLTTPEVLTGVTFLIEARRFVGMPLGSLVPSTGAEGKAKKLVWTGYVDLAYHVERADGARFASEDVPDGIDRVKLRVAPWVLFGSLGPHDQIYSSEWSTPFVEGNQLAAEAAGAAYPVYGGSVNTPGGWNDVWTEDFFQTGWTGFPGENGSVRGMRIFNARPYGRPPMNNPTDEERLEYAPIRWILGNPAKDRPPAILGPDMGGAAFYDPEKEGSGHTQDSHGNHDLVPAHEGYPLGRIITGNKVMAETSEFYEAQGIQGPPIELDTTWLWVEHVDEFFHWVPAKTPRGWKLLAASPTLMTTMLEELENGGQGSAVIHQGMGGTFEMTVSAALQNPDLAAWSQLSDVKIQGHIEVLKAETGLTDAEIIELPTWFEDGGNGTSKVAWNPGMVNMRMMGNVADIAKPFGPMISGADPFETDVLERLGTPASGLGSDGQGLKIFFTNDWDYHVSLGEVHCGTNESGPAPFADAFWWESGK